MARKEGGVATVRRVYTTVVKADATRLTMSSSIEARSLATNHSQAQVHGGIVASKDDKMIHDLAGHEAMSATPERN